MRSTGADGGNQCEFPFNEADAVCGRERVGESSAGEEVAGRALRGFELFAVFGVVGTDGSGPAFLAERQRFRLGAGGTWRRERGV